MLEALAVAASDSAAAVVDSALDAVEPVVEALYRGAGVGVGHDCFPDTVAAVAAAMRNPRHQELSIDAVRIMQSVARRLAESSPEVSVA